MLRAQGTTILSTHRDGGTTSTTARNRSWRYARGGRRPSRDHVKDYDADVTATGDATDHYSDTTPKTISGRPSHDALPDRFTSPTMSTLGAKQVFRTQRDQFSLTRRLFRQGRREGADTG